MRRPFVGRKANLGAMIFLGVILFNIVMYLLVFYANQDPSIDAVGTYRTGDVNIDANTTTDLTLKETKSWADGFKVSVFGMPSWVNVFYVTFQLILISLAIYMLIRGV